MNKISIIQIVLISTLLACNQDKGANDTPNPQVSPENKIIPVGSGPDAMYLTPDNKYVYIANVEDTTVSIIGTETNAVVKTISGIRNPWGFSQLGNSGKVAVSGYGGQVVIIDNNTQSIIAEKEFSSPIGGITTSKNGNIIYVIFIDEEMAVKLDAVSLDSLDSYPTGQGPDGIGISANDNKLYVTNTSDGNISIIDMANGETTFLETGGKPELVHANKDRNFLFISNFFNNVIHVINTDTDEIIYEIDGLSGPEEAVLSEDENEIFVVNFSTNKVFRYNAKTFEKIGTEYETGTNPIGAIPFEDRIYVTNYGDNSVSLIYLNDQEQKKTK